MDTNRLNELTVGQLWATLNEAENEQRVDIFEELYNRSYNSGEYAEAATIADQMATEAEKCMSSGTVENAYYKQGLAFWKANRYEEAMDAFNKGINKYEEPNSKIELSKNQWGISSSLYNSYRYAESVEWANKATESALAEDAYSMAGLNKYLEAQALYYSDRELEALAACEEARGYRRQEKQLDEVATIDAFTANIHAYLGNYEKAVDLLRNCLVLAEATSSSVSYYSYRLGNALIDKEEYDEARLHLQRAKNGYEENEDHASLADCLYSLCLTYRRDDEINFALENVRSAISLWDALGNDKSYIKGLEKLSILLFNEDLDAAIEINQRLINFIATPDNDYEIGSYGWALLRLVDCLRLRDDFENGLSLLESTDLFGLNSTHSGNNWYYSLKSRMLYALGRHDEAMGVADTALSQTVDESVSSHTAYLYEIKARVSLEQNRPDKERHLAHAIALHLAFGETNLARDLSSYFKPKFSPAPRDLIMSDNESLMQQIPSSGPMPESGN